MAPKMKSQLPLPPFDPAKMADFTKKLSQGAMLQTGRAGNASRGFSTLPTRPTSPPLSSDAAAALSSPIPPPPPTPSPPPPPPSDSPPASPRTLPSILLRVQEAREKGNLEAKAHTRSTPASAVRQTERELHPSAYEAYPFSAPTTSGQRYPFPGLVFGQMPSPVQSLNTTTHVAENSPSPKVPAAAKAIPRKESTNRQPLVPNDASASFSVATIVKARTDIHKDEYSSFDGAFGVIENETHIFKFNSDVYFVRLMDDDGPTATTIVAKGAQLTAYPPYVAVGDTVHIRGEGAENAEEGDVKDVKDEDNGGHAGNVLPYPSFSTTRYEELLKEKKKTGKTWSTQKWEVMKVEPAVGKWNLTYRCAVRDLPGGRTVWRYQHDLSLTVEELEVPKGKGTVESEVENEQGHGGDTKRASGKAVART